MRNSRNARRARWIVSGAAAVVLAALVAGSLGAAAAAVPVNTKEPSVAGSPTLGKDLNGDRGTWTGAGIAYTYRWLRCTASCAEITGATATKYTVVSADLGATIRFEVTATNADGKATATSNPTAQVSNASGVPANTAPPTISGTASVGSTLASTTGTWVGDAPITYQYQWQRCDKNGNACKNIGGATKDTYKVADADANSTIRLKVTAKNARGKSSAISVQTALVGGSGGGGGGGGGGKSVDVADVPKGERLIVDKVTFSPSPVRSRSTSITVTIVVKDTRGNLVRNAYVFLRSTPIVTSTPTDAQTGADGTISYSIKPESDFPIKNGYSVQFFVKAYRKGDPALAGISGSRLVQVPTAK
jgi:hypothetical protein